MSTKTYPVEQIITKLREVEVAVPRALFETILDKVDRLQLGTEKGVSRDNTDSIIQ